MYVTNNHKTVLGLPNGTQLQPGVPTRVRDWDKIGKNAVVKAWLKAGVLKTEESAGDAGDSKFVTPDKAELQAKLDALNVQYDKRSGVAKLQQLLDEAEAKKSLEVLHGSDAFPANIEIAEGQVVQLGDIVAAAHAASELSVEDWNGLPDDERDALLQAEIDQRKADSEQA